MKFQTILSLLIIAGFFPLILADSCRFYTDTNGYCVKKCRYPKIADADTKTCLADINSCTKFFVQTYNVCSSQCPQGFIAQEAKGKQYQICIPCEYKDDNGKCYESCPVGMITEYTTQRCLSSPTQCQAYYTKDLQICQSVCLPTFVVDNSQTPKICVNCFVAGTCADPQNKPINDNNNNNNSDTGANKCNLYLAANMYECLAQCPPQQIALPKVQGQSYIQCQMCPPSLPFVSYDGSTCVNKCNTGEYLYMFSCIKNSQCNENVFTDPAGNQVCVKNCPPFLISVKVKDQSYSICQSCPDGQVYDIQTNQCLDKCPILDATGQYCLNSLKECNGYISIDQKKCLLNCPSDQYGDVVGFYGQNQCVDKCQDGRFILKYNKDNVVTNYCVVMCPYDSFVGADNICTPLTQCTNYLSMDGLTCLTSCPSGQFPQMLPTSKLLTCMPCLQKLSSDGKSCSASCASDELFDIQIRQCKPSSECTGIKQDDLCLLQCQPGYILLSIDKTAKPICISISNCPSYVSSDRQSCVKSCGSNEGITQIGSQSFCVLCPLGLDSNGVDCKSQCPSNQIYDVTSLSCKDINKCPGLLSANGLRCVAECQFPEVKPSPDATQCAYACKSGQLYQDNVGCIDKSNCTGYQSSNGQYCIQNCYQILELIGDTNSSPKTCLQCPVGSYPKIQQDNSIQCLVQETNVFYYIQGKLQSALSTLGTDKITPAQKSTLKDTFQQVTFDLEKQIGQATTGSQVKTDQIQSLYKQGVKALKTSILDYLDKLTSYDSATNIQQAKDKIQDQNQLLLGSNKVQIVAEKKKNGYSFKLKFNLQDLISNSVVSLQQDDSVVPKISNNSDISNTIGAGVGDAAGQTNSKITAMQVTYLAVNPNCLNCPTGLTTIDTKTSGGRFRNLQSQSGQTYQLTYNVNPSQITKTICVSYNSNNVMTVNPTSINSAKNQITCTFTSNSSLFYDSNCQYVSKNLCASQKQKTDFDDKSTPSSSKLLNISLAIAFIFAIYI
ncbi:hypothetical protein ABPG74_010209 [Tetrahymena malaccensis]